MKIAWRLVTIGLLIALAGLTAWLFWRETAQEGWLGYVEGEALYIAAPTSGRLTARMVKRGGHVAVGTALFTLDPEMSDAGIAQLQADVSAAKAQLADLTKGQQREPELAASHAVEAIAAAQLIKMQRDFDRISALAAKGFVSNAQFDAVQAARDVARATLVQTRAQFRSGRLPAGRHDQIKAAQARVASIEASLRAQRHLRLEIAPLAPAAGTVEQTFYDPGEWVPASSPVVALLPDNKRKLRFYVPQDHITKLHPGMVLHFTCDGCRHEETATVNYISPRVEFTPPVIYSERMRAKLVYLVEAALPRTVTPLTPGLPVAVIPR